MVQRGSETAYSTRTRSVGHGYAAHLFESVEAAIAKSRLDDHEIFCALADENVNLYGGGPLAMPIRLLVAEDQAEEATRILKTKGPELPEDFDPGIADERPSQKKDINEQILS